MEKHPIPQDVTGFQFKLIGEMTIKQFAYLASGVTLGAIIYLLPVSAFVKLPFTVLFSFFGIGFAFVPVSGRPMDVMVANFIRALFRPTQFIYQPTEPQAQMPPMSPTPTSTPAHFISTPPPIQPDKKEPEKELNLEQEAKRVEQKLGLAEKEGGEVAPQKALTLQKELQELLSQKETLAKELLALRQALEIQKASQTPLQQTQTPGPQKKIMPVVADAANLVNGLIKDPRGNPLGNILVEVKDEEGNPVRAFKTNGLGQFVSATSLLNGTYTIGFEDPKRQHRFQSVQFAAKGEIIPPFEVISMDEREQLRRELFDTKPTNS